MLVNECVGRIRVCVSCGRKFWNTEDLVFADRDSDGVFCVGKSLDDRTFCVEEWARCHPGFLMTATRKKISDVQRYIPNEVALAAVRR